MERRLFIKRSGVGGFAIAIVPGNLFSQEIRYSMEELMGKADIDLYGEDINLRKEAHDAFVEMRKAALADGIDIKIVSGYRSFDRQAVIFERKYLKYTDDGMEPLDAIEKIIEYSTIPGTSRHHWGTDVDLIDGNPSVDGDVLVASKFGTDGPFEKFKLWMDENSEKFDYYLVYTNNPKRRGFKYEPWHYSYAPLSRPMLKTFRLKNILKQLKAEDFLGSDDLTTEFVKIYIEDNILDINPELL
ncbi:M15 family metallopeptidase [Eudoraea adriatica]|uniref:M15 family metallopeptidase n=1 Tax=Eudoraea adriatica TaxID=446681 RepID=UPI0003717359|nr:M15 family metallopeptidase [Eudoraea adriatica]